jgi:hypothetical protein
MRVISTTPQGVFSDSDEWSDGWEVVLTFTDAEVATLLASYDPASGTSPAVTVTRPLVRELLDALLAAGAVRPPV